MNQIQSNTALQGDGDGRPFDTNSEPDESPIRSGGPRLAVVHRRGPDFGQLMPIPVAEQLGQSLMAQAVTACGEVLQAIHRDHRETGGPNPMEVIGAWSRLLRILKVQPERAQIIPNYGREDRWVVVRVLTHAAFANMQALDANRHWMSADAFLRHFMGQIAHAKLKEAQMVYTGLDELEDGPAPDDAYLAKLGDDADALLSFAEGRA